MMEYLTNFLSASFLHAAGWTVIHSLWMGVVLIGLVLVAQHVTARNHSGRKYLIAFVAQILLFLLSAATFIYYFVHAGQGTIGDLFLSGQGEASGAVATSRIWNLKYMLSQHTQTIAVIYITGVALLSVKMALGYQYIRRLRKQSWPLVDDQINILVNKLKTQLSIRLPIDIRTTNQLITPLLTGLYRPFVLMPLAVINCMDIDEVECILAHELAHFKRYDHIALFVQQLIETLLYFNPAIWVLGRQIHQYREEACDDIVVSLIGSEMNYAKSLVRLQELKSTNRPSRLALSALGRKGELLNRIKRIMNMENNNRFNFGRLALLLLLPLALVLLSFYSRYEAKNKKVDRLNTTLTKIEYNDKIYSRLDTVPVPKGKSKIIEKIVKNENGKEIEAEFENNELKYLKIDGQEVDPSSSEEYEVVLEELTEELAENSGHGRNRDLRVLRFRDDDGNESIFDIEIDDANPRFRRLETEDGMIFELDGNRVFEFKGSGDGEDFRLFFDEGEFNLNNDFQFDIQEHLGDLQFDYKELMNGFENLHFDMPEIIRDQDVIILRNGDEHTILELNGLQGMSPEEAEKWESRFSEDMEKWAEEYSQHAEKWAEKYGKEAEKWAEKYAKEAEKWAEKHADQLENNEYYRPQQSDEFRQRQEEIRRYQGQQKEMMRQRADEMREIERDQHRLSRDLARRYEVRGNRMNLQGRIEKELRKDGFMSEGDDYTFKLNDKKLRINGKKQSDAMYEKYKDIYENYTGVEIEKGSSFSTSNTGI